MFPQASPAASPRRKRILMYVGATVVAAAFFAAGAVVATPAGRGRLADWLSPASSATTADQVDEGAAEAGSTDGPKLLELSRQARQNLGLAVAPVRVGTYTRTLTVPGVLTDRPGVTDRGVTSPAVGTVVTVHAFPGETVPPGGKLFTVRLFSEYLQQSQKELFQAVRDREINKPALDRARQLEARNAGTRARTEELEGVKKRLEGIIAAQYHDLITRGLTPEQVAGIVRGRFVSTVDVFAPPAEGDDVDDAPVHVDPLAEVAAATENEAAPENEIAPADNAASAEAGGFRFEVQSLAVELGQQVQAGQLLATLADHRSLFIEGHAFKREAAALARAAERHWPVEVEFAEDEAADWPPLNQDFRIRHLANTVDPESRTFDFYVPLENQSRTYERDGETFTLWRFRPGQRVRLRVPIEEYPGVITLPAGAVVREGPEAFVFQQNGDLFRRLPVRILHEDAREVVLANDGSVPKTAYLAQGSAATLNRVLKAQEAGGEMPGVHVHADGTVHAAH
ncbi:efflux RND transporter periplasmic adaptor subunit [Alienimonas sp. DA493]|uniref:efflux RND transporter periplasmic adaptor subunit n=1 Tax=Alienimonas sp. DA493 TaxID=3373605 RepID=UPI003754E9F7